MKKNLFFGLFATMVLLLTTACQKENDLLGNGEATISFEISTPQMATRAFSDGTTATQLQYAVYDEQGNPIQRLSSDANEFKPVIINDFNGKRTINIQLAAGKKYNVLFWASAPNSPYSVNYTTKELSVDYTKTVCNSDANDAFYCYKSVTVDATKSEPVTLKRPFAQLNIGTNDLNKLDGVKADKTRVAVTGIYETLNLATKRLGGDINAVRTFALAARPVDTDVTVGEFPVADYDYLAMAYLLVGEEKKVVNVEFSYGDDDAVKTRTFTNIPVMANYRTNIYGALLTNNIGFDVEIKPGYNEGDLPKTLEEKLALAAQVGGTITLTEDVVLSKPLVVSGVETRASVAGAVLEIDLDGHAITYTSDVAGNSAMITVNSGNKLVVKDSKGTGKISYQYTGGGDSNFGWGTYTIANYGTLVVENGTIEMLCDLNASTATHMYCAVFQYSGSTTINGGKISTPTYRSARLWKGDMTINDGVFEGQLWVHAVDDSSVLTINGGSFAPRGIDGSSVFVTNDTYNPTLKVTDGTFATKLGCSSYTKDGVKGSVSGGVFGVAPDENLLAEGYKAVESNGKRVVVANDVDAVVSTQEALNNATFAEGATIVLTAGEYVLPDNAQGKTFTIQGTNNPADVKLTAQNDGASEGNCDYSLRGSKVTFNNITVTTTGTYFPGYAYMEGTFNNCIINGVYTVYESSSFNDCTFNVSGNWYNLWTWGGEEVNLNNCTFNCDGKAVLLYGTANTKLTANNCTFNDNGDDTVTGKAAIEIGNDYNKSYELVVNNATVNGFAINPEGYNTGSTLWANKNSMGPDKLIVTIDGENGYKVIATEAIENMAGTTYSGDFFENTINNALYFNNWVLNEDATIKVNRTYGAIILENVSGNLNGNVIEINNDNNSVMVLQDCNFTLQDGMKLIKSVNTIHQVFMSNITINGVKLTQANAAEYLENVGWYQVVEEI